MVKIVPSFEEMGEINDQDHGIECFLPTFCVSNLKELFIEIS